MSIGRAARWTRRWARPSALPTEMAAFGVEEIVDETMANAARVHAIERGKVIGDCTLIAFGGAAPLHAARLAEKLGIARVIVPAQCRRRLRRRLPARADRVRAGPQPLHAPGRVRCRGGHRAPRRAGIGGPRGGGGRRRRADDHRGAGRLHAVRRTGPRDPHPAAEPAARARRSGGAPAASSSASTPRCSRASSRRRRSRS